MKTLYIVRHAKSSWDYPHLNDIDRPLNKRGEKDAPEMGKRLKARNISPGFIISSPAIRAITTCRIIARALSYPQNAIEIQNNFFHSGGNTLLRAIQKIEDRWESAMIFGHNPGFTDFANSLTNAHIDIIPTCGIVACSFDVEKWSEVNFGKGQLLFFDYPKKSL